MCQFFQRFVWQYSALVEFCFDICGNFYILVLIIDPNIVSV